MTTHKADLGDHDGRKHQKNYTLPFGKVLRDVVPDHSLGIYKPSKRCYDDIPIPKQRPHKHPIIPISLKEARAAMKSEQRKRDALARGGEELRATTLSRLDRAGAFGNTAAGNALR